MLAFSDGDNALKTVEHLRILQAFWMWDADCCAEFMLPCIDLPAGATAGRKG